MSGMAEATTWILDRPAAPAALGCEIVGTPVVEQDSFSQALRFNGAAEAMRALVKP